MFFMKILIGFFFALVSIQAAMANDYAAFKQLFDRGVAPASVSEVETFLSYQTQCLGMSRQEYTSNEIFVVEDVIVRPARGPAFPEVTKKAILLGKSENRNLPNLNYQANLTDTHLSLNTTRNIATESCDYYDELGTICSTTYTREDNVKVRIKMNGSYLVFFKEAQQVYGYCW